MRQTILDAMSKAFFASAWAEQAEETGNSAVLSGNEIFDIMPTEIDPAAVHAATTLLMDIERVNGKSITEIYDTVKGNITEKDFGHYSAMQAMGEGVGLEDYGIARDAVKVPYTQFGAFSLEKDYFEDQPQTRARPG